MSDGTGDGGFGGDTGMTDMGDVGSVSVTGTAPSSGYNDSASAMSGNEFGFTPAPWASVMSEYSGMPYSAAQTPGIVDQAWGPEAQDGLFGKLGKFAAQTFMGKAAPGLAQAMTPLSIMYNGLTGKGSQAGATIAGALTGGLSSIGGLFGAPTIGQSFAAQAPYAPDATTVPNAINGVNDSQGGQTGGSNGLLGALGGLGQLYSMYTRNRDSDKFANTLSSMYGQNSPYAAQLKQSLARQDAAAGRRSQYGAREVELQARLAQAQAGVAPSVLAAQQNGMNSQLAMLQQLGALQKMGVFNGLSNLFSGPSKYDQVNNFGMTSLGQLPTTQYQAPEVPDIATNPGGW